MKRIALLLIGIVALTALGCSDDDESGSASYYGLTIISDDNKIIEPEWLGKIINNQSYVFGVYAVECEGEYYYSFGNSISSNSCIAFQFWDKEGKQVACFSDLYNKLLQRSSDEKNKRELWTRQF